jgi:hypothetical protein
MVPSFKPIQRAPLADHFTRLGMVSLSHQCPYSFTAAAKENGYRVIFLGRTPE